MTPPCINQGDEPRPFSYFSRQPTVPFEGFGFVLWVTTAGTPLISPRPARRRISSPLSELFVSKSRSSEDGAAKVDPYWIRTSASSVLAGARIPAPNCPTPLLRCS